MMIPLWLFVSVAIVAALTLLLLIASEIHVDRLKAQLAEVDRELRRMAAESVDREAKLIEMQRQITSEIQLVAERLRGGNTEEVSA